MKKIKLRKPTKKEILELFVAIFIGLSIGAVAIYYQLEYETTDYSLHTINESFVLKGENRISVEELFEKEFPPERCFIYSMVNYDVKIVDLVITGDVNNTGVEEIGYNVFIFSKDGEPINVNIYSVAEMAKNEITNPPYICR